MKYFLATWQDCYWKDHSMIISAKDAETVRAVVRVAYMAACESPIAVKELIV